MRLVHRVYWNVIVLLILRINRRELELEGLRMQFVRITFFVFLPILVGLCQKFVIILLLSSTNSSQIWEGHLNYWLVFILFFCIFNLTFLPYWNLSLMFIRNFKLNLFLWKITYLALNNFTCALLLNCRFFYLILYFAFFTFKPFVCMSGRFWQGNLLHFGVLIRLILINLNTFDGFVDLFLNYLVVKVSLNRRVTF